MGSLILQLHLTHLNTMGTLNAVIVTLLKLVSLCSLMLPCLFHIGPLPSPPPSISSTAFLPLLYKTSPHSLNSLVLPPTTINFAALGAYAILGFAHIHPTNFSHVLYPVSLLGTLPLKVPISVLTRPLIVSILLVMCVLSKPFFPLHHLILPSLVALPQPYLSGALSRYPLAPLVPPLPHLLPPRPTNL